MKTNPVNSTAAQSPGPHPSPMESGSEDESRAQNSEFERVEHIDDSFDEDDETPPPQTWKHPDDGKTLSEKDQEIPLKP
ncbi:MAG TPA: hypothetical protein VGC62_18145 [Pseudomonas sp.]|uniref:hypothetical protein n=1 Tax=Pseudomonas sp. TaxID=306 RepID=UPI002ED7DBEA